MSLQDQFDAITLDTINGYVANRQGEDLFLDFKTVADANLDRRDDRKTLAKAMSGFANSSGGLIVWGVLAQKNADGIDCATGTQEIEPVSQFVARLNEMTNRSAAPVIDGVQHKPIVASGDRGFAVTLVPESDSGPHMAKLGEDRYYKRNGDAFLKMEHFDLEDMFGRRKRPKLSLEGRVTSPRDEIVIGIRNVGRGTAKAPYLSFRVPQPFSLSAWGVDGNGHDGLPKLPQGGDGLREPRYGANLTTVIHPDTTLDVCKIEFRGREENRPAGEFTIEYQVSAEDVQIVRSRITINVDA